MLQEKDVLPWYKQFWPWFLITIPIISVILGITLLVLATSTKDSLVKDDYYKEGKAINKTFKLIQNARDLAIATSINVTDENITLRFLSGEPSDKAALTLDFFHATLSEKDTTLLLSRTPDGSYRVNLDEPLHGKWKVTLHPFHNEWKIQQTVELPSSNAILLQP